MAAANPKPVALVTDYDMGAMNGLDLIVSSHKIHPSLKTILLSGTIDGEFISRHPARVDQVSGQTLPSGGIEKHGGTVVAALTGGAVRRSLGAAHDRHD